MQKRMWTEQKQPTRSRVAVMAERDFYWIGTLALSLCLAAGLILSVTAAAQPYDPDLGANWRCGNLIMEKGLFKYQVVDACGEPNSMQSYSMEEYGPVEKLVYGPDAGYMYTLIFQRDRLMRIEATRQ